MLEGVQSAEKDAERMLVIDTCGEGAGVAVSVGETVVAMEALPTGGGSAGIVDAVRRVLASAGISLKELAAIGVVSGPGSFTGVRVGMAAAKGLSEAVGLRMLAVSRLRVLRDAAGMRDGMAALDAGRGECYVRDADGLEWLASDVGHGELVVAEERLAARLQESGVRVRVRALSVADAVRPLLGMLREGDGSAVLEEANYVRSEVVKGKG